MTGTDAKTTGTDTKTTAARATRVTPPSSPGAPRGLTPRRQRYQGPTALARRPARSRAPSQRRRASPDHMPGKEPHQRHTAGP
jgi:hypothetical protein